MRRLRLGEWLAGAGGLALLVSLFLTWYSPLVPLISNEPLSGFESMTVIDILLALVALLALSLPVLQATQGSPARPVAAAVLTTTLGFIAVLLVIFRLIDVPRDDYEVLYGAWLALAATVVLTVGAWLAIATERVPGVPPGPEPELRPAPLGS